MITAIIEFFVAVACEGFHENFIVFMAHGPFFENKELAQLLLSFRCATCAYTYAILAVHFLYRYLAVCRPPLLAHFFDPLPLSVTVSSVFLYGGSWMWICWVFLWPDEEFHSLVDYEFVQKYNISANRVPFLMANYKWPIVNFWRDGIVGMAIATVVSIFAMAFYVVMAYKIHETLKFCLLSMAVRRMHGNMLRALGLQTLVPLLATCIPCLIAWYYPVFKLDWSRGINAYVVPFLSSYPAVDPLVILFVLADYRNAIMENLKIRRRQFLAKGSSNSGRGKVLNVLKKL